MTPARAAANGLIRPCAAPTPHMLELFADRRRRGVQGLDPDCA
jgi:hypothetical protein